MTFKTYPKKETIKPKRKKPVPMSTVSWDGHENYLVQSERRATQEAWQPEAD